VLSKTGARLSVHRSPMPILRITSAVERYRYFASPEFNIHALSGHGEDGLPNIEFVSARILSAIQPEARDVVLDVGCGDGYLLSQAAKTGAKCIGVVPTREEQEKLQAAVPGINFRVGLAQNLPLDSGCASKIVCNSVLLLLENENNVRSALTEISRVAQFGARIWLGEVPAANELAEFHVYNGTTTVGRLSHEWRTKGLRSFLATLRSVVRSRFGKQTLLLDSCSIFHAPPDKFIRLASACGLHIQSWQKHKRLDAGGERESAFRYNYMFSKSA
jgi:SAM-dependent methyltransferase